MTTANSANEDTELIDVKNIKTSLQDTLYSIILGRGSEKEPKHIVFQKGASKLTHAIKRYALLKFWPV